MRQVTASGGSAARGRPLPASTTVQRLQAWHPSTMGFGFKGLRSARNWDGQPPGARKVTRHSTLASRFCGRTNSRGYASRDCIGAGRPPDGARLPADCPAVAIPRPTVRRRTARGVRRSPGASPRCPRGARLRRRNQASGRTPLRVADRLRSDVLLTGFEAAPAGAAAVLPRYYLGYLNSWSIRGKRWKGSWGPALDAEFRSGTGRPGNRDRRNSPAGRRRSVAQRRVDPHG